MDALPYLATIGILGNGQLGRMIADAAHRLGFRTHCFGPGADTPAGQVCSVSTTAEWDDLQALAAFANACDVITLEFENVPVDAIRALQGVRTVHPSADVLHLCRNRLREKDAVQSLGIPTAPYAAIRNVDDLRHAASVIGLPAIIKTTELGYDGKGQSRVSSIAELEVAFDAVGAVECVLEGIVPFDCEISVIAARARDGSSAQFPVARNVHRDHILHTSTVPAGLQPDVEATARAYARRIAEHLDVVGLIAVEFFVEADGTVRVNELAPRPHNSGHWSMDGCQTSQFEQLVRAVAGLPLGQTNTLIPTTMTNLIGDEVFDRETWLNAGARLHLYGKSESRPGRKMGHVNVLNPAQAAR
jgi:5-(carboxyamino)imidazole ribonucleotide synthase